MNFIVIERTSKTKLNKSMIVNDDQLRLLTFVNTEKNIKQLGMSNKEIISCLDYFAENKYFVSIINNKLVSRKSQIKNYYQLGFSFYKPVTN